MTEELNAVINTIYLDTKQNKYKAEIVVSDSHGNKQNVLLDKILRPELITFIRGQPRPLSMMEGIDSTFNGVFFIGYHSGAHQMEGVRAHTMSSAMFAEVYL